MRGLLYLMFKNNLFTLLFALSRFYITVKHDYSEHAQIESLAFRYLRVLHYIIVQPMS